MGSRGYRLRCLLLPTVARLYGPAAIRLVPRAAPGWTSAVRANHGSLYAQMAGSHGLLPDAYMREVQIWLWQWATSARIRVRMDTMDVSRFLQDGRYRNQFETGTSKGVLAPGRRMLVEHTVLGVPTDAALALRPTYGYCTGSLETHPNVIKYGDAVLLLRPEVNHRTTFTFGDSLDEAAILSANPPFCPAPLSRPGTVALDCRCDVLSVGDTWWEATRCGYIEAQIHGGLTPVDVECVVFTLGTAPDEKDRTDMQASGIQWRTVPGDEP